MNTSHPARNGQPTTDNGRKTICPYCGVGCGMIARTDSAGKLRVVGDPDHPANLGKLCPKGGTMPLTLDTSTRLKRALLRESSADLFASATPDRAVQFVADRLKRTLRDHGPNSVAFYVSGQLTTETEYLAAKFVRAGLGTNHIDANSRLCMASAATAYKLTLGADGPPCTYSDIDQADLFFIIGSNTADCHPITFDRILKRRRASGAKIIVVDPRRTATAREADLHLAVRPGTDLALLYGMLHVLIATGQTDESYIARRTEGFDAVRNIAAFYGPRTAEAVCGVAADDIVEAALLFGKCPRVLSMWTMGLNQSVIGTWKNAGVIHLHLATGKINKPGCGPFSLTGQPNAMGGRMAGYLCHQLPGFRAVNDPAHRGAVERLWNLPQGRIADKPGYDATAIFDAVGRGEVKFLWVIGTNPAVTMPKALYVERALAKLDTLVVQDAYHPTETSKFAHAVLPGAVIAEVAGTMINTDRCVTLAEPVSPAPGDARPDWLWLSDVAAAAELPAELTYKSASDIFDEMALLTAGRPNCDLTGLSFNVLRQGPRYVKSIDPTTPRNPRFATPDGRARFLAVDHLHPAESVSDDYPFVLTTGRLPHQWHTRTKTGHVDALNRLTGAPAIDLHPDSARRLDVHTGDGVRVRSRTGEFLAAVRVTDEVAPGVVFAAFHWGTGSEIPMPVNRALHGSCDPLSGEPELKHAAVTLVPEPSLRLSRAPVERVATPSPEPALAL